MKIKEAMTPKLRHVPDTMSIRDAATVMREQGVGLLAVMHDDRLVGTVTDRDLVTRGLAEKRDPVKSRVRDCMSADVVSCRTDESTDDAVRLMTERRVRRLVVLDETQHPAGVISLSDIASRGLAPQAAGQALGVLAAAPRGM